MSECSIGASAIAGNGRTMVLTVTHNSQYLRMKKDELLYNWICMGNHKFGGKYATGGVYLSDDLNYFIHSGLTNRILVYDAELDDFNTFQSNANVVEKIASGKYAQHQALWYISQNNTLWIQRMKTSTEALKTWALGGSFTNVEIILDLWQSLDNRLIIMRIWMIILHQ